MRYDEIGRLWVVEYSRSQRAFNTQELWRASEKNLFAFLDARESDYVIIAVAQDQKSANDICKLLNIRDDRTIPIQEDVARRLIQQIMQGYGKMGVSPQKPDGVNDDGDDL
jgi:hypothetical protein